MHAAKIIQFPQHRRPRLDVHCLVEVYGSQNTITRYDIMSSDRMKDIAYDHGAVKTRGVVLYPPAPDSTAGTLVGTYSTIDGHAVVVTKAIYEQELMPE
jgi:hypothetical protein